MLRSKPLLWLACCLRGQFPKIAPIAKITQFFEFDIVTGFTNWVTDYTNWYARKSFIISSLMRFRPSRVGNRFACLVVAARNRTSHMERRNFLKIVAAGVAIASTKLSTKLRSAVAADNPNPSGASAKPACAGSRRTGAHGTNNSRNRSCPKTSS